MALALAFGIGIDVEHVIATQTLLMQIQKHAGDGEGKIAEGVTAKNIALASGHEINCGRHQPLSLNSLQRRGASLSMKGTRYAISSGAGSAPA